MQEKKGHKSGHGTANGRTHSRKRLRIICSRGGGEVTRKVMKTTRQKVQCRSMDISQDPRKFKGRKREREREREEASWDKRGSSTVQSGIKEKVSTVDPARKGRITRTCMLKHI